MGGHILTSILILILLFLLIFLNKGSIFASFQGPGECEGQMQAHLQDIFNNRIWIWNNFLLGNLTLEDVEDRLKESIGGELLAEDLKTFEDILKNPTSYETIEEVTIKKCELIKKDRDRKILLTRIQWSIRGFNGLETEELEYIVHMKRRNNSWFMNNYLVK